ncbi:chorismate transformation enzyme, FkbO/Hyg5 family [Marilutibacter maris]|uniref:Pteridine-dependent deoxygenase n=1 Tax=Marilutibacter maris TaxID=1605891 RepID=A0A2U9T0R4_9GAMM|nr:pteridine-dependent deoxygenase [Lysobacter maris]AWV06013.1 pteridine-dependent deoxygenase [Lysobacter maris]KAB8198452.1 pteridine-dependent deoxygenase [Lysobacter maris]
MSARPAFELPPRLAIDYVHAPLPDLLDEPSVLAVLGFGSEAPASDDPRYLRLGLQPHGPAPLEVWRATGPVVHGRDGDVAWARDGTLLFGAVEVDEPVLADGDTDIDAAADAAYRRLEACIHAHGFPHLLRTWNYIADITAGHGDDERYRRFCSGRARGITATVGEIRPGTLPAATAIGRSDGVRRLQVYWLAARRPGTPLENPRQVSAWRYPRQYGPQPPSFARAMLPPAGATMPLMLSGTAAVVGHQTRHAESVADQVAETFANFDSLLAAACARQPALPARFDASSRLKVYVRDRDAIAEVERLVAERLGPEVPRIVLHAAICRRDLRMEIDGAHG